MAIEAEPTLAGGFPPATEDTWLALVDKVLKGAPFDKLVSATPDGISVPPLYTRDAAPGERDEAGFPGAAPFTRAAAAAPRPHGAWDVRTTVTHPDPAEANRRLLDDLERGVTSALLAGTDPTALPAVLEGVHLDLAPVVLRPGARFDAAAQALESEWTRRGVDPADALGGFGADPIGVLAAGGDGSIDVEAALPLVGALAARTVGRPKVTAAAVDTLVYVDAGASEAQELAAMLATAAAYLRAMAAAGLDADAACARIEVTLGVDADVFTTVAKLRAARRLWATLAGACGASAPGQALRLQVRTATRMLTARDPWVNLLRGTAAAFAGVVGGADGVTVHAFDSLLGEPGELGRRMARNTQLLLQDESNLGRVIDPAGGSWYVESLTDELATTAWALFQELEAAGGLPAALRTGWLQERIAAVRDRRLAAVATRRQPVTGVSEFPLLTEDPVTPGGPRRAVALPPPVGEGALVPVRWAEGFESLRDAAEAHTEATGSPPVVFLANLGPVATHTARATFAKNFFEAGGIRAVTSERGAAEGLAGPDEAAQDLAASGARIACICSSDARYAEQAVEVAAALRTAGVERLYLAGNPGERRSDEEAAGVDEFVHIGVDVLDVLRRAHDVLGVAPPVPATERKDDGR